MKGKSEHFSITCFFFNLDELFRERLKEEFRQQNNSIPFKKADFNNNKHADFLTIPI